MAGKNKISIVLEVDDKGTAVMKSFGREADKGFDRLKAHAKTGATSAGKMERAWRGSINHMKRHWIAYSAAATAALAAVTAVATIGIQKTIHAASKLEEVTSKFNVVFAGQTAQAEKWAKTLVDSYVMSTREAKQYLSSVQDLLVPMGMNAKEAGKLSNEIVKLSADLGSFNDLPTADVMRDIQSALTGEYQTMKKYGVILNATTVQEKALAMGLAGTKKELTAAHKAQATYAMMIKDSQAAIGDQARTMGSYANQLKQWRVNIEEVSATIGTELLPYATSVVKKMNEWVKANKDLIKIKAKEWILKIVDGVKTAIKTLKFFSVAWLNIKLVASKVIHAIAVTLDELLSGIRVLFKPLDLLFEVLKKMGRIENNPFDKLETALGQFRLSSADVTEEIIRDIAETEDKYNGWIDTIEDVKTAAEEIPPAQEEIKKTAVIAGDAMKTMGDKGAAAAEKTAEGVKKIKPELTAVQEYWKHTMENIHDATADTFYNIFQDIGKGWSSVIENIKNWFLRLLAEMAAQAIARPIILPIVTAMGGVLGLSGTAQAAGGGFGMPPMFGGGQLLGQIPGVSGFLGTPVAGWGGTNVGNLLAGGQGGLGMGATWGGVLGAAGLGALGYGTIGNWIGLPQGKYSSIGAGLGGGAGMYLGGLLGGIGGPIGAVAGTLLGGVLSSFIGGGGPGQGTITEGIFTNIGAGAIKNILGGNKNTYEKDLKDLLTYQMSTHGSFAGHYWKDVGGAAKWSGDISKLWQAVGSKNPMEFFTSAGVATPEFQKGWYGKPIEQGGPLDLYQQAVAAHGTGSAESIAEVGGLITAFTDLADVMQKAGGEAAKYGQNFYALAQKIKETEYQAALEALTAAEHELTEAQELQYKMMIKSASGMDTLTVASQGLNEIVQTLATTSGLSGEEIQGLYALYNQTQGTVGELTKAQEKYLQLQEMLMNSTNVEGETVQFTSEQFASMYEELQSLAAQLGINTKEADEMANSWEATTGAGQELLDMMKKLQEFQISDKHFNIIVNESPIQPVPGLGGEPPNELHSGPGLPKKEATRVTIPLTVVTSDGRTLQRETIDITLDELQQRSENGEIVIHAEGIA